MSWIVRLIGIIVSIVKGMFGSDAELKRLKKRLQEIKNEQAKTHSSARFNVLDTERLQICKRIADIRRGRQTSISVTKK